jgi:protein TonB
MFVRWSHRSKQNRIPEGNSSTLTEIKATMESKDKFRRSIFSKSDTQPSLFHYVKEKPDPSVFEDMDWSFLTHPIRSLKEAWRSPRPKASLFHYIEEEQKIHLTFKEILSEIFTGFRNPLFIPSVFSDPESLAVERAQGRTRRWEANMVSLVVHVLVFALIAWLAIAKHNNLEQLKEESVFVNTPIYMPKGLDDKPGGGGGGGGKNQPTPPAKGQMAPTRRIQLVPPDPANPRPLIPAEELMAQTPSVEMPIDLPFDQNTPIGDITAPPNPAYAMSSGPGTGGGIGTGTGTGIGSGKGSGVGSGEGSGMGGGRGTGIGDGVGPYVLGNGVKEPVPIVQPLPPYTEEARKARVEGIVVLQAVIRKDGTVDSFKILKGLGHGLDSSAIDTIASKWRFRPGTLKGTPVDVIANIEVRFRMF